MSVIVEVLDTWVQRKENVDFLIILYISPIWLSTQEDVDFLMAVISHQSS